MTAPFVKVVEELKCRALVQQHALAIKHIEEDLAELDAKAKLMKRKIKKHSKELEIAETKLEEILKCD